MTLDMTVPGWVSPQYGGTASGGQPVVHNWDDPPPNPAILAGYGSIGQTPAPATPVMTTTATPTAVMPPDDGLTLRVEPETVLIGAAIALAFVVIAAR